MNENKATIGKIKFDITSKDLSKKYPSGVYEVKLENVWVNTTRDGKHTLTTTFRRLDNDAVFTIYNAFLEERPYKMLELTYEFTHDMLSLLGVEENTRQMVTSKDFSTIKLERLIRECIGNEIIVVVANEYKYKNNLENITLQLQLATTLDGLTFRERNAGIKKPSRLIFVAERMCAVTTKSWFLHQGSTYAEEEKNIELIHKKFKERNTTNG